MDKYALLKLVIKFELDCQCTVQLSTYQAWDGARCLDFGLNFQTHPYFNECANNKETDSCLSLTNTVQSLYNVILSHFGVHRNVLC